MFAREALIVVIFRGIYLIVITRLVFVIIKQLVKPALKEELLKEEKKIEELSKERDRWIQKKGVADHALEEQQALAIALRDRVRRWHAVFHEQAVQRETEKAEIKKKLETKHTGQARFINTMQLQKKVNPHLIHELKIELERRFASQAEGERFIEPIIDYMKEGAHASRR